MADDAKKPAFNVDLVAEGPKGREVWTNRVGVVWENDNKDRPFTLVLNPGITIGAGAKLVLSVPKARDNGKAAEAA